MTFETVTIGTTRVSWPILGAALIALPIGAAFGLRTLKTQPASAFAQPLEESSSFKATEDAPVSGPAMALVSQFNAEASRGFGPSPMISKAPPPPKFVPQEVVVEPVQPTKQGIPQVSPPPELQVSSIMAASGGQMMAVINGKLRRVGDAVGNGFAIKSINKTSGEVLIVNRRGDQATFTLKNRSDE